MFEVLLAMQIYIYDFTNQYEICYNNIKPDIYFSSSDYDTTLA